MAIGLGVIGTGKHGARYVRHVHDVPALRLAAICRRDAAAGRAQAEAAGCRFHDTPEALIEDPEVEAVVTVVPPVMNVWLAGLAARAGKALLIEKPLAPTVSACREIAEAVTRAGVTAMVAHTLRFNAVVAALRAALPSIGDLHAAALSQRFEPSQLAWLDRRDLAGGGNIIHTGVHTFDALRFLTGREALRITAASAQVVTRDTEDNFAATIEMDDGLLASVAGSRATAGRSGAIELAGRDGQLVGDHVHGIAARLVGTMRTALDVGAPVMTVETTLAAFADAVRTRREPAITLADGAKSVAIAETCYRAIASGRTETVPPW